MSTRALYTFRDQSNAWNVYKHHDGYPSGAAEIITDAIDYFAWTLPRFEADEFACAFIAAAKAQNVLGFATAFGKGSKRKKVQALESFPGGTYRSLVGGGVRLMPQGEPALVATNNCADIEYRYEIMMGTGGKKLIIKALAGSWYDTVKERVIFYGPFEDFKRAAKQLDSVDESYSIYTSEKRSRRPPLVQHVSTGRVA